MVAPPVPELPTRLRRRIVSLSISWDIVLNRLVPALFVLPAILIGGCAYVPSEGPTNKELKGTEKPTQAGAAVIQIVDVDDTVAQQLLAQRSLRMFSETLGTSEAT